MRFAAWASTLSLMISPGVCPSPQDFEGPVFQPGEFVGREGLVRNLLWRLGRGESLSIVGGPKLGKTSLLLHLAWQLNQASPHPRSAGPPAVYFDLAAEADHERLLSQAHDSRSILLLDNCDDLVGKGVPLVFKTKGLGKPVIVYAGGRKWREFVRSGGLSEKVHPVPLAVFLEKEARLLFHGELTAEQRAKLLTRAGTHPFVLKILQTEFLTNPSSIPPESSLENDQNPLSNFFRRCLEALQEPMEHEVLTYLIQASKPVNPREVARAVGLPTVKPIADTLCYLGLTSRWIRDEEATLLAGCAVFNDWYVKAVGERNA